MRPTLRLAANWAPWLWLAATALAHALPRCGLAAARTLPVEAALLLGAPLLGLPRSRLWRGLAAAAWVFGWTALSPTPLALLRSLPPIPSSGTLRVVTLNCAGGDPRCVEEALRLQPRLILLQESPSSAEIRTLLRRHPGWSAAIGLDASILALGRLRPLGGPERHPDFVAAEVRLAGEPRRLYAASLRLQPPLLRLDFWNPGAWNAYADDRRSRKRELERIADDLRGEGSSAWIFGGDFNVPPDPCVDRALSRLGLQDAFSVAGRGWGGTGPADFPLVRIDRILCPRGWRVRAAWTVLSAFSDHRMVVADLEPAP
ncbi:MAG: endonuclease/exonuclease/phosphatase family protein [Fimbriimonadaceae bacterium]